MLIDTHASLTELLPEPGLDGSESPIRIGSYRWQKHCSGLYQTPHRRMNYEFAMDRRSGIRHEQDQRGIKRRVNASQGFRSFEGAWRTIQGYEVLHMIRNGQVRWLPKGDVLGQIQVIRGILGLKAE